MPCEYSFLVSVPPFEMLAVSPGPPFEVLVASSLLLLVVANFTSYLLLLLLDCVLGLPVPLQFSDFVFRSNVQFSDFVFIFVRVTVVLTFNATPAPDWILGYPSIFGVARGRT